MKTNASTWKKWGLFLVVVLALMVVIPLPVAAFDTTTLEAKDVSSYTLSASPNSYIFEIIIDSLPVGTNQTHIMNFNGLTYMLEIETVHSYGVNNDFWVTMTYPNGTSETVEAGQTSVFQTYKTKIQPVYMQLQGFTMLQIDLAIGTNPTQVTFSDLEFASYDMKTAIPFTSATGSFSGQTSTVYAYQCSKYDFENSIVKGDLLGNLNILGQFFAWSWEAVLAFINMIPVIGPQFATVMVFVYTIAAQAIYWISYIVRNSWLIIGGLEVIIAMMAFLLSGKRPTPERVIRKWADYNVRAVKGFIWSVDFVYRWLREFINMIANVVNGLKPI